MGNKLLKMTVCMHVQRSRPTHSELKKIYQWEKLLKMTMCACMREREREILNFFFFKNFDTI